MSKHNKRANKNNERCSNTGSKRSRKRSRGGIGCLVGDGESNYTSTNDDTSSQLRVEIVPVSEAIHLISKNNVSETAGIDNTVVCQVQNDNKRRIRIVYPYPYTFATFAKARWIGRTVLDVYNTEFG
jgi:hypothetical protein